MVDLAKTIHCKISNYQNIKLDNSAQTPATRATISAAWKLASFADNNPLTTKKTSETPEEPAAAMVIAMDQLSTELAKQRTSLRDDVSFLIQEAT